MMSDLERICSIDPIFQRYLLPYLTAKEVGRLEGTSRRLGQLEESWKSLCRRDYVSTKQAPVYNGESFDRFATIVTYKAAYQHWTFWKQWTHGAAKASDMVLAIDLWRRFKEWCQQNKLTDLLGSLCRIPPPATFATMATRRIPSSLVAFLSVHGGQTVGTSLFCAMFGCYHCYDLYYCMCLMDPYQPLPVLKTNPDDSFLLGASPVTDSGLKFLLLVPSNDNPEGSIAVASDGGARQIVGHGGILSYFATFVERLEAGMYPARRFCPTHPDSRCISLFPDAGETCSCAVTKGIQVRASARWFPSIDTSDGLNFGYSIRIQLVEADDALEGTCQLVGRHWEFTDGNGHVRLVDGEAVVGKQPLFFRGADGKSGYVDLGAAGEGEQFTDCVFSYQSMSGPVAGTTVQHTGPASVRGSFSFVQGSIEEPQGEIFHVTVAPFPLTVSLPFY